MLRWVVALSFFIALSWYSHQAIKTAFPSKTIHVVYLISVILVYGLMTLVVLSVLRDNSLGHLSAYIIGTSIALMVFQLLTVFALFFEDIFRILHGVYSFFASKGTTDNGFWLERRKLFSHIAIITAALPFGAIIVGMIKGRYNYKVLSYEIEFDDLPKAFDGFKITQFSDLHTGSLDDKKKVAYGLSLINQQKSDLILFTGDLVNDRTTEAIPFKELLSNLKAKMGVFSVLGNHDYGDYINWDSEEEKVNNLNSMYQLHKEMGWRLLRNESVLLEKENQAIALVGVENWGTGRFKKKGDLNRAINKIDPKVFKILMSHDPSHWDAKVLPHSNQFQLTLSGHTHGMQFGVEIPGFVRWSPASWRYKQWAGLYEKDGQWLNVNRGFGYLVYPGRFGIWPEITNITLKRKT